MARLLENEGALEGRRVFLRTSYDLPLDVSKPRLDPARVSDDSRIRDSIATLKFLVANKARIILEPGWLGRPKGEDPELSMGCVAKRLEQLLKEAGALDFPVLMSPDALDGSAPRSVYRNKDEVRKAVARIGNGQVLVLENVRYDPEENAADGAFGEFLASLAGNGALYVNEAEAQNHRPCSSVTVTPIKMAEAGGDAVLGFQYQKAVRLIGGISKTLSDPSRGKFAFFLTGKKIETQPGITSKITVAGSLLDRMKAGDVIVIQGAVCYTFLLAQQFGGLIGPKASDIEKILSDCNAKIRQARDEGKRTGDAKAAEARMAELELQKSGKILAVIGVDEEKIRTLVGGSFVDFKQVGQQVFFASLLLAKAKSKSVKVITARDHLVTDKLPDKSGKLPADAAINAFDSATGVPANLLGIAPGPKTVQEIVGEVLTSRLVLLAGPVSIEDARAEAQFGHHRRIFEAIGKAKEAGATTVAAGGDTAAFVNRLGAQASFSIVSNAGGATLELIERGTSAGLEAVEKANAIAVSKAYSEQRK